MNELGLVGIRDMGVYSPLVTYNTGNFVYYDGSTYKVLRDNLIGVTPSDDGVNYGYLARGFNSEDASLIEVVDTYGYVIDAGEKTNAQSMFDSIARIIDSDVVVNSDIVNTGTTGATVTGKVLDARQANPEVTGSLAAQIASQNDALATLNDNLANSISSINTSLSQTVKYIRYRQTTGRLSQSYTIAGDGGMETVETNIDGPNDSSLVVIIPTYLSTGLVATNSYVDASTGKIVFTVRNFTSSAITISSSTNMAFTVLYV